MPQTRRETKAILLSWFGAQTWGGLRDAALLASSCVYVLGYLAWCLYAWDRGLGLLPPLQGQYFIAGLIPTLLCVLGVVAFRAIAIASGEPERTRAKRLGERLVSLAAVSIFAAIATGRFLPKTEWVSEAFLFVGVSVIWVGSYYAVKAGDTFALGFRLILRLGVAGLVLALTLAYSNRIFPLLPQEFGGAHPVCARLDLTAGGLSSDLASQLLGSPISTGYTTIRSRPLWLHFEGSSFLWLSLSNAPRPESVIRVRHDIVEGITSDTTCRKT